MSSLSQCGIFTEIQFIPICAIVALVVVLLRHPNTWCKSYFLMRCFFSLVIILVSSLLVASTMYLICYHLPLWPIHDISWYFGHWWLCRARKKTVTVARGQYFTATCLSRPKIFWLGCHHVSWNPNNFWLTYVMLYILLSSKVVEWMVLIFIINTEIFSVWCNNGHFLKHNWFLCSCRIPTIVENKE